MPSFRTIFALAATAFAALSSAAPVTSGTPAIDAVGVKSYAKAAAARSFDIVKRDTAVSSLPQTLLDAQVKLTVVAGKLNDVTTANVDVQVVFPILDDVRATLITAIASVKAVVGQPVEVVLGLQGKVLSVVEVAKILSSVLTLIATTLASVVRIVGVAGAKAVLPIVASIGVVLCELLTVVFGSVNGLVDELAPLLGPVTKILLNLSLANVVQLLRV